MLRRSMEILLVFCAIAISIVGCGAKKSDSVETAVTPKTEKVPLPERTVHVFCYHGVEANTKNTYFNCPDDFREQMHALKDAGCESITCEQLADYLEGKKDIPEKSVIITFDDGNLCVYQSAVPIMDEFGYTATLFVITDSVNGAGQMTWEQLGELQRKGYEIGSHTVGHVNLAKCGDMTADEHRALVTAELQESKKAIEDALGIETAAVAYPYGTYEQMVMTAAEEAGYRLAFSIDRGPVHAHSEQFALPRQMVVRDNSLRTFKRWLVQEPLCLTNMSPALGEVSDQAEIEFRAELTNSSIDVDNITIEGGRKPQISIDSETEQVIIRTTLREGANNVRLQYQGDSPCEKSWVVVYRP